MEKRYQVFISSTYEDLKEERTEVIQALLELDCFPSGMELFPASTESQWNWIKKIIDESDYYVLIIGGRYGTISKATNLGYVEMEYRYAIDTGKPTIAFINENIDLLPSGKVEKDADKIRRYSEFRAFVETKLCKKWINASDLGAKVSRSITQLIKTNPAIGWIRASDTERNEQQPELLSIELQHKRVKTDMVYDIDITYTIQHHVLKGDRKYWRENENRITKISIPWIDVFNVCAKKFLDPQTDWTSISHIKDSIISLSPENIYTVNDEERIRGYSIPYHIAEKILFHFLALGYLDKLKGAFKLSEKGKELFFQNIGIIEKT